jgi:hypothetical protein
MLLISAFFFLANIHTAMATKTKIQCQVYKGLLGEEKTPKSCNILKGKKRQNSPYFDNEFLEVRLPAKTKQDP